MAKKGFQHHRLLNVKDLFLNLKALALRKSEDEHSSQARKLSGIRSTKQEHLSTGNPSPAHHDASLSTRDLQIQTWHTEQLNEDLRQQVREVRMVAQEVEQRRKVVEMSAKEKQTLEKLKEHQDREASRELEREEQRRLDEIAGRKRSPLGGP